MSPDASPRPRRQFVIQAAVLFALVTIAVVGHVWYGLRNHFFDLMVYRDAMLWWTDGHPLYDYARPDETQGLLGFTYPPATAFLLRPLAYLSPHASVAVFCVIATATIAASIWWLTGPVARRHGWPRWFVFAVAFVIATSLVPISLGFDFGQINPVLWALIVFDLAVLAPRGSRFLGVGIGLATAIKLVPGIFILYLLLTRRRRATIVAAATAGLVTLVAGFAAPAESKTFWTQRLLDGGGLGQLKYPMNQALNGLLARLADPALPSRVWWVVLVVPVFIYGMWRARRAGLGGDELTGMALTGFVGSLISPLTWAHHIFWFAPALLAMVDTATSPAPVLASVESGLRRRRALFVVIAVVYAVVAFNTIEYWEFSLSEPGGVVGFVLSNCLMWLMLVLLVVLPIDPGRTDEVPSRLARERDLAAGPLPEPSRPPA